MRRRSHVDAARRQEDRAEADHVRVVQGAVVEHLGAHVLRVAVGALLLLTAASVPDGFGEGSEIERAWRGTARAVAVRARGWGS